MRDCRRHLLGPLSLRRPSAASPDDRTPPASRPGRRRLPVRDGTALGHRRLSSIDLSSGDQPIFNEGGTKAVVFNGEIHDFQELRCDLEVCGHLFRTVSDTETTVHAREEYGDVSVSRLRGMVAFALWDLRHRLLLARDRVGEKPLLPSVGEDPQLSDRACRRGDFATQEVRRRWVAHQRGARNYASLLWALIVLESWRRQLVNQPAFDMPPAPDILLESAAGMTWRPPMAPAVL